MCAIKTLTRVVKMLMHVLVTRTSVLMRGHGTGPPIVRPHVRYATVPRKPMGLVKALTGVVETVPGVVKTLMYEVIGSGLVGSTDGFRESRRCSRDTYKES